MKWIAQWKIMATYCVLGIGCSLGTTYLSSEVLFTAGDIPFSGNILCLMGISFFLPILCFAVMFAYAICFGSNKTRRR